MNCFKSIEEFYKLNDKNTIVTIGSFDGVHTGHRMILKKTQALATSKNLYSVVLTFDPHPRDVVGSGIVNNYLMSLEERCQLIFRCGIDAVIIHPFTKVFSRISAHDFLHHILLGQLKMKHLVIGKDHTFGQDRVGDVDWLKKQLYDNNFSFDTYKKYLIGGKIVSSTVIRDLLKSGQIKESNKLLGSTYSIKGKIVHGKKIGQKINFPTANIELLMDKQTIPKYGVYHMLIKIKDKLHEGVANIGVNPTIDNSNNTRIEAHIFNFSKDIYNEHITIYFLKYIRNEIKFSTLENLKKQIIEDIKSIKKEKLCLNKIHINK